jgi:hypothetical protein
MSWANALGTTTAIQYPALSPNTRIETPRGFVQIDSIRVGDIIYGQQGVTTEVLGICKVATVKDNSENGNPSQPQWSTNMIGLDASTGIWKRSQHTGKSVPAIGVHLITELGTFLVSNPQSDPVVYRDYTEVGYSRIEAINECVEVRLRSDIDTHTTTQSSSGVA